MFFQYTFVNVVFVLRIYYFGGFGPEPGIKYININGDFNGDPDFIERVSVF
jgi:hypothetical protein